MTSGSSCLGGTLNAVSSEEALEPRVGSVTSGRVGERDRRAVTSTSWEGEALVIGDGHGVIDTSNAKINIKPLSCLLLGIR